MSELPILMVGLLAQGQLPGALDLPSPIAIAQSPEAIAPLSSALISPAIAPIPLSQPVIETAPDTLHPSEFTVLVEHQHKTDAGNSGNLGTPKAKVPPPDPAPLEAIAPSPPVAATSGTTPRDRQPVQPIATAAPLPMQSPTPATTASPRPGSGSQLYLQRRVALAQGRTYTRLSPNSFWESWIDATAQPTYEQWVSLLAQEAQAMTQGQGNNALTVMVGDSISQWFPVDRLSRDRFWLNQGISGDNTAGILRRLSAFSQTRPDTIHVMAGINDLRQGATDNDVLWNLRLIMRQLRQTHPQAQIVIHSILPTRDPRLSNHRIQQLNQQIAAIAYEEEVTFLNLMTYFSDTQGDLRSDLTTDGLHLNGQGYAVWDTVMQAIARR